MTVSLPTPENHGGTNNWSDVYSNDKALKEAIETLQGEVSGAVKPVTWYKPTVIATEETRESTSFGTLTTKDEITGVVVPANGLIVIGYAALVKSSVSGAGRLSIFIGSNQLKRSSSVSEAPVVSEVGTLGTAFTTFFSDGTGLAGAEGGTSLATTGHAIGSGSTFGHGPLCVVFLAPGTYNISVQYKATSGSVTAKERKLWVEVHGF